jgi:ribosomal 50S subunit-associated protein YjgA (DUF615 family)
MQITVFKEAKDLEENDIFIVTKDSVEGHDKAILKLVTEYDHPSKSQLESDIRHTLKNHYEEMPENLLRGIHSLVERWFHEKELNEGLDAFDRREK